MINILVSLIKKRRAKYRLTEEEHLLTIKLEVLMLN